jgi:transcriptional regulator with XRE-family HTH domain
MITLPMDKDTFTKLRNRIGFSREELAVGLSLGPRHIERYELGTYPIPDRVAKLLIMFARFGVPDDFMRRITA